MTVQGGGGQGGASAGWNMIRPSTQEKGKWTFPLQLIEKSHFPECRGELER